MTTEEWKDYMKDLMAAVYFQLLDPVKAAKWVKLCGGSHSWAAVPVYSFDNPRIHTDPATLWELMIITNLNRLVLPPTSPDLHKVIEHSHGVICGRFQQWLNEDDTEFEMAGYCRVLQHIFHTKLTPESIQKDVETLTKTYEAVVERGGEKAPPGLN